MSRWVFQFLVIVIVLVAALTPLADTFDTWDHNPVPSCDTELQVACFAVAIGVVITLANLLRFHSVRITLPRKFPETATLFESAGHLFCTPTASPPTLSLRI